MDTLSWQLFQNVLPNLCKGAYSKMTECVAMDMFSKTKECVAMDTFSKTK